MGENAPGTWLEEHREHRVVQLKSPIREGGKTITELHIRQPVVNDLEQIPAECFNAPIQMLRVVLASCAGVSGTAIRLLTLPDMKACAEALTEMGFTTADAYSLLASDAFLPPETGTTGSV